MLTFRGDFRLALVGKSMNFLIILHKRRGDQQRGTYALHIAFKLECVSDPCKYRNSAILQRCGCA